jgi:hypothetical protein
MNNVSTFRLYLLRAMYLFIVVGLGVFVMPGIIQPSKPWEMMHGVVNCMLVAFWLLSMLGLRYPLQMLPVLMWELLWKGAWLLFVGLPLWRAGTLDAAHAQNLVNCLVVVIVPFVIPWRYVFENYFKKQSDAWGGRGTAMQE